MSLGAHLTLPYSYDRSIALQKAGDPRGSTEAYLAALDAQAKLRSMPIPVGPEVQALPSELYALIFRMLSTQDLLRAAKVSRGWRRLTRDSRCAVLPLLHTHTVRH